MSAILATFYNPKQKQDVAIAVGTVSVASFLLYQAYASISNNDAHKKTFPRAPMGILETIRMMSGPNVPSDLLKIAKDLGSWNFELSLPVPGHPKVVVISEVEDVKAILKDSVTLKSRAIYGQLVGISPTKTPSLFTMNADSEWHRRRKGTAPAFSQKHVRRMNEVAVQQTEKWLKEFLTPLVEKNESFDVVEEILKLVLKAFSETAFQYNISDEEIDSFIRDWNLVSKEFILKSATNPLRKYLTAFLPERQRAAKASDAVHQLFHRIIDNYRNLESPIEGTVLDLIMKNPTFKNDYDLVSEIFAYAVAGSDTTALSISWILLELAKHPQEQRSLREALAKTKPEEWSKSSLLQNVAREGMRLQPVAASSLSRETGRDMVTKEGIFLPKGTLTFLTFYLTFHNEQIFENAEEFKPSRWENPTELMKEAFMPFAVGKQNCIGQALANVEIHCVLARMIQEFDFSVVEKGHTESYFSPRPVGLRMKATRAKK